MAAEYRAERKCWTFRFYQHGKRHKGYGFATKADAIAAEKRLRVELETQPRLPQTCLQVLAAQFLQRAASLRGKRRYEEIHCNLENYIIPHFGATTLIDAITPAGVEEFMVKHLQRVKPITVWHYIKDLKALLNWAIREELLVKNPTTRADLSPLRDRKAHKLPLNLADFDTAANCLTGNQRLWFDLHRFMGPRKGEGNALQVKHLHEINGQLWLTVPGRKTADSWRTLPVPPILWEGFRHAVAHLQSDDYIFGRTAKWSRHAGAPAGGPVLVKDRRAMFKRIKDKTGLQLKPKDLRDYFASICADATVASKMLGHTNLRTTAIYTREVQERMLAGVKELGQ